MESRTTTQRSTCLYYSAMCVWGRVVRLGSFVGKVATWIYRQNTFASARNNGHKQEEKGSAACPPCSVSPSNKFMPTTITTRDLRAKSLPSGSMDIYGDCAAELGDGASNDAFLQCFSSQLASQQVGVDQFSREVLLVLA